MKVFVVQINRDLNERCTFFTENNSHNRNLQNMQIHFSADFYKTLIALVLTLNMKFSSSSV